MGTEDSPGLEGTEWITKLKVAELKDELKKRGLALTGVKAVLAARLTEAVEAEQAEHREARVAGAEQDSHAPEGPQAAEEQPLPTAGQEDNEPAGEAVQDEADAAAEQVAEDIVNETLGDAEQQPAAAEAVENDRAVPEPAPEAVGDPVDESAAEPQTTDQEKASQPDAQEQAVEDSTAASEPLPAAAEPVPSPHAGAPEEVLDFDYPETQDQQQGEDEAEEPQSDVTAETAAAGLPADSVDVLEVEEAAAAPSSTGKRSAGQLQQQSESAEQPSKRSRHTPIPAPESRPSAPKTPAATPAAAADTPGSAAVPSTDKKRKHAPIPAPPARSHSKDLQKQPSNASIAAVEVGAPTEEQENQVAAAVEAAGDLSADATAAIVVTGLRRPFTPAAWLTELSKTGVVVNHRMTGRRDTAWVIFRDASHAHATRQALNGKEWPQGNKSILRINFVAEEVAQAAVDDATGDPAAAAAAASSSLRRRDSSAAAAAPAAGRAVSQQQDKPAAEAGASAANDATSAVPASGGSVLDRLGPQNVRGRGMPAATPIGEGAVAEASQPAEAAQPAPKPKQPEVLTLDDLFRKTTTKPCLYYLPLTDEQVAAKKQRASGGNSAANAGAARGSDTVGPAVQEGLTGH